MENAAPTTAWGNTLHPQERKPRRIRVKLETVTDARKEMSKLYREARAGKLDVQDASRLANILMLISRMIECSDIERRLEVLEAGAVQ